MLLHFSHSFLPFVHFISLFLGFFHSFFHFWSAKGVFENSIYMFVMHGNQFCILFFPFVSSIIYYLSISHFFLSFLIFLLLFFLFFQMNVFFHFRCPTFSSEFILQFLLSFCIWIYYRLHYSFHKIYFSFFIKIVFIFFPFSRSPLIFPLFLSFQVAFISLKPIYS